MSPKTPSVDVLVVGAGPTGLFLASELARHGIPCRIIDKAAEPSPLSRALVVHARSLEIFEQAGLVNDFLAEAMRLNGLSQYMRGKRFMHADFQGVDSPYPFPACLEQSRTEQVLTRHLAKFKVTPERAVELQALQQDQEGVTATLKRADGTVEEVRAGWLVGCDGAHSATRHLLNLPFEGSPYPLLFALADVHMDWPYPHDEVLAFQHRAGAIAAFPLPEAKRYRLLFDVTAANPDAVPGGHGMIGRGGALPAPTLADVQQLLDERLGEKAVATDPHWLAHFRIHCRQVPRYRVGRVFLSGDAAHIHSPVGGQGMNTGLQDSFNLAWKLALAIKGRASETLLDSYSTERHAIGQGILKGTDRATRLFTTCSPLMGFALRLALRIVPRIPKVRRKIVNGLLQLSLNYRTSPIVSGAGHFSGGPMPGDRAPDGVFEGRRLFEELTGSTAHHLLIFAAAEAAQKLIAGLADWVQPGLLVPHTIRPDSAGGDSAQGLWRRYGVRGEGLCLIRPDGYVGFRADQVREELVRAHLTSVEGLRNGGR